MRTYFHFVRSAQGHQVVLVTALFALSCARHDVDLELPHAGRALTSTERGEAQRIADSAFRDVRAQLEGMSRHPDGRRWIGIRVGTEWVDRASRATGKTPATLVFASTDEIKRSAKVE